MRRPGHNARQVARSLASLVEALHRVARTSDRGWLEERDDVVSVATGMLVAAFKPTFVVAPPGDPAAALERVCAFYARTGLPGEVNAWDDTTDAIGDATRSARFVTRSEPDWPSTTLVASPRHKPQVVANTATIVQ